MSSERHQRLKELFQRAEELRQEEREAFLLESCPDDPELRKEVERLLDVAGQTPDSFLEPEEAPRVDNDAPTLEKGRVLLHYRVVSSLGQGGMGEVYRAVDTKLDREVALKVLPLELAADPERLDRFKREAKSLAALDHPGIVTIYSVDETDGIHFLTMSLVKGQTLSELIPEEGLPLDDLYGIVLPLTEAVGSAHRKGITHRDLKPGNVMVTSEGAVKVLDFGLAKSTFSEASSGDDLPTEALTVEGRILGTVAYMSPEQAEGKPVDPQSDVFSLGILLYEMTTGQRPFQGDTTIGTLSAVLQANPTPVAELKPEVSPGLATIIECCLEGQPSARYGDASEVHEALRRVQDTEVTPSSAAASSDTTPERRSGSRRLWAIVAVIAALAVLALWLSRGSPGPRPEKVETQTEAAKAVARPVVAVMPFQNLGSSEDEYFAIGMTEEIATRMSSVPTIGVIATSSTRQYADTQKTAQEIGEELGAGYLVTGSVLWARSEDGSSKIRITPKLISTVDDTQIWAQSYDRLLDDIFAIHTDIASQVVSLLGISLADPDTAAVAELPTDNLEAYDAYLRAMSGVVIDGHAPSRRLSIEYLNRAVELDPEFSLAWSSLAIAHSWFYYFGLEVDEESRRLTLEAVEMVEETAPGSALAAAARGHYLYRIDRDYKRAIEQLTQAVELDPNLASAFWMRGSALRRNAEFEAAAESYEMAVALDPRNSFYLTQLGADLQYLRRFEESIVVLDRAIGLPGDVWRSHYVKVESLWYWADHLAAARQALGDFPVQDAPVFGDYLWFWQEVYEGDLEAAAERLRTTSGEWLGRSIYLRPKEMLAGLASLWLGEEGLAQQQLETAVAKIQARLVEVPDNEKLLSSLGVALAALGRGDEALEAAVRATEIVPLTTDPWFGQSHLEDLAWVYTLLGDYDSALEQLEILLERPSRLTISFLEMDPRWAPLWDHPRFKELQRQYGQ